MARIFTLLIILVSIQVSAQQVPNGDFENWTKVLTYENPDLWDSPNPETSLAFVYSVTKESSDIVSGNHAARLKTIQIPFVNITIPGFLTLADFSINTTTQEYSIVGGEPFQHRPDLLVGYYKYAPVGGDAFFMGALLSKYNDTLDKIDTIGGGYFESTVEKTEWTYFAIPIEYYSDVDPDTLNIVLLSSGDEWNMVVGSTLMVDSLAFIYCNMSIDTVQSTDCTAQGSSDGTITVMASGGSGNLEYSIDGGNTYQDSPTFTALNHGTYHVIVRDKEEISCELISEMIIIRNGPNAIYTKLFENIEIFPNPAQERLILKGMGQNKSAISLYNSFGQRVYQQIHHDPELEIDLNTFENGIYFLQIDINGESYLEKIVISRN